MLQDIKTQFGSSIHSMRKLFERPITVKQGNITLGLASTVVRDQAREERRQRVKQMRRDLFTLMEQHPGSRQIMRHLDLAERTLRKGGLTALEGLPIRVIAKALNQMEQLVSNWSPVGLAELRSRMAVMVKNRAEELKRAPAPLVAAREESYATDVTEVDGAEFDHADFEEMERSWAGRLPVAANAAQAEQPEAIAA